MYIVLNVIGDLDWKCFDEILVLMVGFLVGIVSGVFKVWVMEIIDEFEKEKCGFYVGCVGYFFVKGDMNICIVFWMVLVKDGMLYV